LRIAIPVTAEERNQTLYEMRELLHALFFIDSALSNKDFKAVIAQAKPVGPLLNKFPDSITWCGTRKTIGTWPYPCATSPIS
jgi:hypothetical protein